MYVLIVTEIGLYDNAKGKLKGILILVIAKKKKAKNIVCILKLEFEIF